MRALKGLISPGGRPTLRGWIALALGAAVWIAIALIARRICL